MEGNVIRLTRGCGWLDPELFMPWKEAYGVYTTPGITHHKRQGNKLRRGKRCQSAWKKCNRCRS